MKPIFIVIGILFLLLLLLKFKFQAHIDIYSEGFANAASKSVIICKADWCGHCKAAADDFQKIVAASPITLNNGSKVTVKMLDADRDKDELAQYQPKGFPTIFITDGANMTEYPGPRTYNGVIEFLNGM